MANFKQIIELYSTLADFPQTDFGWAKGLENAKAHHYSQEWFEKLPTEIWEYCAAVGNPFKVGKIEKGITVVDLGCGAGVDLLVSAYLVGEKGKAIGVDITPKMVAKSKAHAALGGFNNIQVLESSFDSIDIEDGSVDVVISNGAINLTSCKESVFAEIHRILKNNGKIYFADMIDISKEEDNASCSTEETSCCTKDEDNWANCVAGTLRQNELINIIQDSGFKDVECTGINHYTTADTTQGATFKATKTTSSEIRKVHWDKIYTTKNITQVFWYQSSADKSLELIKKYSTTKDSIIDMGCGTSFLVDNLLATGYTNISLLDTSIESLHMVQQRISNPDIKFICSDILDYKSEEKFDIWHDRAVFHFLENKEEKEKYFEILLDSLKDNGICILSTFKVDGDITCAGLDVVQYNEQQLEEILPKTLKLVSYEDYLHTTPKNTEQKYIYFAIKKVRI